MAGAAKDKQGQEGRDSSVAKAFIAQLDDQERMLIVLQRELYEGSWQAMMTDLRNRLAGKPYIFKLANRIREDIRRIEKLQDFEEEHQIKLANFVNGPKT